MEEELDLLYRDQIASALYDAIRFEFRDIKHLEIKKLQPNGYTISFEEGIHTKEEVLNFINTFRKDGKEF